VKECSMCKTLLSLGNFRQYNSRGKLYYKNQCRQCEKEYNITWKIKNKEHLKNYSKSDKIKMYRKEYYKQNKHKILLQQKERFEKNPSIRYQYYLDNKDKYIAHSKKRSKFKSKEIYKKRKQNPLFSIINNLRSRMSHLIKRNNFIKNQKFFEYLGCSLSDFKLYLEAQFDENMSWDNYGSYWHIDHIKPISLAVCKDELYKLNHYLNLQPLKAIDNRKKGNNYDF